MQKTTLICNNFSGINRTSSIFDNSVITAVDMQNVELFSTETNSGVGIRTANGNIAMSDLLPENEIVINIFESIQKSINYFFVHTENNEKGKIYLFNPSTKELTLKVENLSITGKSSATDVTQGWSDLWIFSNGIDILSIELGKTNDNGELDEIKIMDLIDTEGRKVQGLGLVIFAGRLWIFNKHSFTIRLFKI